MAKKKASSVVRRARASIKAHTGRSKWSGKHSEEDEAQWLDDSTAIRPQLAKLGRTIADITGDGNCMFRAISHQVHGHESQHKHYRELCVKHIEAHQSEFEPFLEDDESFPRHIARMRKDGTYGGNMELVAVSQALKRTLCIHQIGTPPMVIQGGGNQAESLVLHLVYHSWEHYSSAPALSENEIVTTRILADDNFSKSAGNKKAQSPAKVGDKGGQGKRVAARSTESLPAADAPKPATPGKRLTAREKADLARKKKKERKAAKGKESSGADVESESAVDDLAKSLQQTFISI